MTIEDLTFEGPHGTVPVRLYQPEGPPRAGVVWSHGGAFVTGDLDMAESDWVARGLAADGLLVVAVDYRLAPPPASWLPSFAGRSGTSHYPVAVEEVAAAFRWATTLDARVPATAWTIGGASAGANLSAGATLRLIDDGDLTPAGVLLAYPMVHAVLPEPSAELAAKLAALAPDQAFSRESTVELNLNYVGGDPALLAARYAFAGDGDLTGFPRTIIVNSDGDSLRSSGEQLARQLRAAGAEVTLVREDGTLHGHLNDPENEGAHRTLGRFTRWLRELDTSAASSGCEAVPAPPER